jgi:hypothetical protein
VSWITTLAWFFATSRLSRPRGAAGIAVALRRLSPSASSARVLLEAVLVVSCATSRAIPLGDSAVKPPRSRARLELPVSRMRMDIGFLRAFDEALDFVEDVGSHLGVVLASGTERARANPRRLAIAERRAVESRTRKGGCPT